MTLVTDNLLDSLLKSAPSGCSEAYPEAVLQKAHELLSVKGIPEVRNESYKYSNIHRFIRESGACVASDRIAPVYNTDSTDSYAVVIVIQNGFPTVAKSPTDPSVLVQIGGKGFNPSISDDPMAALNLVFQPAPLCLNLSGNTGNVLIINRCDSTSPILSQAALQILVADNATSTIEYRQISTGRECFRNDSIALTVGKNSKTIFNILQEEHSMMAGVTNMIVQQEAESSLEINHIALSGKLIRTMMDIHLNGRLCHTAMSGVYLPARNEQFDTRTVIKHLQPDSESNELYKGIIAENGRGIFNGKVYVDQIAQKTNAYQSNKNMLLGPEATANSKPELEIYADDVKCSHGSTTGQTNEESLFYLRARGIREEVARKLLMSAFLEDALNRISDDTFREKASAAVAAKLDKLIS
jgi:Fe-S cluster assembly protein SufD